MCAGCFSWCRLRMPWGAKKKSTERKTPEVSADLSYAISLIHSCIQKQESTPAIIPATTFTEELKPNEVRWSVHILRSFWRPYGFRYCLKTHRVSFQQKQITLWPPWKRFYPWLNLQLRWPQFRSWQRPLRLHWRLFKYARFVVILPWKIARRLVNFFIRKHRMLNKRSKSCKLGLAISWSLSWTM